MEYKLSNNQLRMLVALSKQKEEAKKAYDEIVDTEQELLAMIIKYGELPMGAYRLKQAGNDVILFSEDADVPKSETPEE